MARTIGEAFVEVRADTSRTGDDIRDGVGKQLPKVGKEQGKKFGKSFGDELFGALKALNLPPIDMKANPRDALAAIAATEVKLKELSGDAATVEVKVRTEKARSELARFKRQLGDVAGDVGADVGPKVAEEVSGSLLKTLGPALAGAGVALAPFLGAAISGAIIGGAGIGGVVGGVLLASRDARVESAGKALGKRFLSALEVDAAPFIDPLLKGLDTLDAAFGREEGRIRSIFANASRYVQPLIEGLVGFLDPVIGGFDDLVAHAGPVIAAIRVGLSDVGRAVGDVFHSLADDGQAAAAAIYATFQIIAGSIRTVGLIINGLTEMFGWIIKAELALGVISDDGKKALAAFKAAGDAATGSGQDLTATFLAAVPAASAMNAAIAPIAPNLQDIAAATRAVHSANSDLFSSETAVATAVADASKKIQDNGRSLSLNSQKGRENRDALSQVASALQGNYDKYVAVNGVGARSAQVADRLRGQFIRLAEKAGLSAAAAKNLADKILDIPSSHDTKITARNEQALEAAREVQRAINAVRGKTVYLTIKRTGDVHVSGPGGSGTQVRAAGGPVRRGEAYLVGERRPEVFVPDRNGVIMPSIRDAVYGGGGVDRLGSRTYIVNYYSSAIMSNPAETGRKVVEAIKAFEQSNTSRWRAKP